jgi:protein-L-isoaspartate O-methyltransferase
MVIPVGNMSSQTLKVLTKTAPDEFEIEDIPQFTFVPLIGREGWKE